MPLKNNILKPGTKFIVTPNSIDNCYGPGTTGFISFVKGRDNKFPNVVYYDVTIVRRGKTGKERVETGELSAPIFDLKEFPDTKIEMPEPKRKFYVEIEKQDAACVTAMTAIDFLGWAVSQCQFLNKLNSRVNQPVVWPKDPHHPANRVRTIVPSHFDEHPNKIKEEFTEKETRFDIVFKLRKLESLLIKCCLFYVVQTASVEQAAIQQMIKQTGSTAELKEALGLCDDKLSRMQKLKVEHGKVKKLNVKPITIKDLAAK